ncbi:MAG: DNA mismatch repair protein MutS [Acidobacteriota bacterium]|nr:DNA mismatch repair protein MutS [Acidobacteriota bacterium]
MNDQPTQHAPDEPMAAGPDEVYAERAARFARERDARTQRMDRVANLRLLLFLLAAAALGWGLWWRATLLVLAGLALLAGFAGLVAYHARLFSAWRRYDELWRISNEAQKRSARDWSGLPLRHTQTASRDHPYAADLDIYGHASLFHLLDTTGTGPGEETLAAWLSSPAPPDIVRERQAAVAELAPLLDLRDELLLGGRLMPEPRPDVLPFLAWAEGPRWLSHHAWLVWLARLSVGALWASVLADLTGLLSSSLWIPIALFNICLSLTVGRVVYNIGATVERQEEALGAYAEIFGLLTARPFASPALRRLQAELAAGGIPAATHIRRIHRLARLIVPVGTAVYLPVQALTLWDFHVVDALERWQVVAGARVREWLRALGEVEALAALAALSYDNHDWAFPQVDSAADSLVASGLGHPLLARQARVHNDVLVGPSGTFLLVTGSNMSGKSTLLRALGTNLVLAGAGGAVCAAGLHVPPVHLWTSMRIEDSLQQGVSHFMAELQRLKGVVDAADAPRAEGERLFYLLDEILQGTNTVERQVAARRIIAHLVHQGALGAVSTHDLTLADEEPIASMARPIYFTENLSTDLNGPRMTFDYRARPGIATSTNALRLMEIIGLDLDDATK